MSDASREAIVEALAATQVLMGDDYVIAYVNTLDQDDIQHIRESEVV
jgi:hypothetical protein